MTDTELNIIAALTMIGLSGMPNQGYSPLAAIAAPRKTSPCLNVDAAPTASSSA